MAFGSMTSACTSIDSVRNSKDLGYVHDFAVPYQEVLDATPAALEAVKLQVIDSTAPKPGIRIIMASHGKPNLGVGEYVRVTITDLGPHRTQVAIITKNLHALASSSSTPEYYGDILLEIGKRVLGT